MCDKEIEIFVSFVGSIVNCEKKEQNDKRYVYWSYWFNDETFIKFCFAKTKI